MAESFQDQMIRRTIEAAKAEIPNLVQSALIQAQNMGFQTVQNVVRGADFIPDDAKSRIVDAVEDAKVAAPPPTVVVDTASTRPVKQDAAVRSWRTLVQALAGILIVAFGDEVLQGINGEGFDITALASWTTVLGAGAAAAVAAGIAWGMRVWTPKGT